MNKNLDREYLQIIEALDEVVREPSDRVERFLRIQPPVLLLASAQDKRTRQSPRRQSVAWGPDHAFPVSITHRPAPGGPVKED